MSDLNEFSVTPSTASEIIKHCVQADRPIMLWGPPGIGKSDIVQQIADEDDRPVIDMRLLIMEPTDLKGIPYYCPESNTMRWAPPNELPNENEVHLHNAILFLDEITAAPPSVQAAAYQLILNRRVGTYSLPKDVRIIAAGNRETDRAVAHRMPSALKNRFVHITMKTNYDDWMLWAVRNNIHPDIVGFLKAHPSHLFDFDPKSNENAFATPRTWSFCNDLYNPELPENINRQLIGGAVGNGLAIEFMAHVRLKEQLPDPKSILSGDVTHLENPSKINPSALYSLTIALCYEMSQLQNKILDAGKDVSKDKNWLATSDRFIAFLMNNMGAEMVIMGGIIAFRTYNLPLNTESDQFNQFFEKYKKYLKL